MLQAPCFYHVELNLVKSILNLANHSKSYEVEKSCFQMAPTCCIFVLSRIVMPSRGPKCLKIYYSRLEDRALTKELVVFLGSSPRAKNLLKRVGNRVIPAATLLHAPRRRHPLQISPQRAGWNWIWTFKFQKKGVPCTRACNFKIATKIALVGGGKGYSQLAHCGVPQSIFILFDYIYPADAEGKPGVYDLHHTLQCGDC